MVEVIAVSDSHKFRKSKGEANEATIRSYRNTDFKIVQVTHKRTVADNLFVVSNRGASVLQRVFHLLWLQFDVASGLCVPGNLCRWGILHVVC